MVVDVTGPKVEFTADIKLNIYVPRMSSQYLYLYAVTNTRPGRLLFAMGTG